MWTRYEHSGGKYTGPAAVSIRPEFRGPNPDRSDRLRITFPAALRWEHDGGADDVVAFEVWRPDHAKRDPRALPPPGWYVLRTRTGQEELAGSELTALGLTNWAPTYRTLTKPRKRRKPVEIERALMPGYLLAHLQTTDWALIFSAKAIIGWVTDGNGPLPVLRDQQIQELRTRVALGEFNRDGMGPNITRGTLLEVLLGPMTGWRVAFMGMSGRQVEGEVEFLGAPRRIFINPLHIDTRG